MSGQSIRYMPGSTQKIQQIVGDFDNQWQVPTQNLTDTNYKIWGTDLGIPFEHKGLTYLLFGDIPGDIGWGVDRDPIAFTMDTILEDGLELSFLTSTFGLYQPITVPGITHGAFEVPVDGISIHDTMYVYLVTENPRRLLLARSVDDGKSFELVENNLSTQYFYNISVNPISRQALPHLPGTFENGLVILGSSTDYRASAIYLACQNADSIAYKNSWYYFAGFSRGVPTWTREESEAEPVIHVNCVGELSTAYNEHLGKWLVLYNCDDPRGINLQYADLPWGLYSDPELIFDPWLDRGYCHFMHTNWEFQVCDSVQDPFREYEWGGEYGPYLFKNQSVLEDSLVTIYYTLSTWNPYTVVLMKSILAKSDIVNTVNAWPANTPIHVYPNPTKDRVILDLDHTNYKAVVIRLYNVHGRSLQLPLMGNSIDLSSLPSGMYYVQVYIDNQPTHSFTVMKI